jgi:hypothetical protein
MHGLINKSIQSFLCDSFGDAAWADIAHKAGIAQLLGPTGFEPMQLYDDKLTDAMITAAVEKLSRPRDCLMEDLGTYLISNERFEPLRRLLRFGGVSFTDFLYSLDDLQGRSKLAVPELSVPDLTVDESDPGQFTLTCRDCAFGFEHIMVGILRALADDYGALAVLSLDDDMAAVDSAVISIEVHDPAFHAGRRFDLAVEVT